MQVPFASLADESGRTPLPVAREIDVGLWDTAFFDQETAHLLHFGLFTSEPSKRFTSWPAQALYRVEQRVPRASMARNPGDLDSLRGNELLPMIGVRHINKYLTPRIVG